MGGTDDPSNLIEVSVEQHAELHFALYLEHGRWQDYIAALGLANIIEKEEVVRQVMSETHKGKTPWNKGKKIGPNLKLKEYHKNKVYTEDQLKRMSEGGQVGGARNKGRKRPDLAERNRTRDKTECQRGPDGRFRKKRNSDGPLV